MTLNHCYRFSHRSGGQVIFWIALAGLSLLFGGCALSNRQAGDLPTLVPTLDLSASSGQPAASSVTVSPGPDQSISALFPTDTQPAELLPAGTATNTLTPWPTNSATPGPSPTRTRTPTITWVPTRTRAPTRTPTITPTPTITYTPTPPPPTILLSRPGLLSKLLSPIQMEMYAYSGGSGVVDIALIGEDGRTIASQKITREKPKRNFYAVPTLAFEIGSAAETARLQVSTTDEVGRLEALSSVDVILLSVGRAEIFPSEVVTEPYLIRQPRDEDTIVGGKLVLQGLARPVNDSPLMIELVTEQNTVLASTMVTVAPPRGALSHTPFTVDVPYKVSGPTPVRLVIRQEGSRIPGTVALNSITLTLAP